jgi:geranylgeranyl reductase family protein
MTLPDTVDVLVIGAGPAGSSAARITAEAGYSTLLIDAKPRIGERPHCGEFVPRQLFTEHDLPRDCIVQSVDSMETIVPDDTAFGIVERYNPYISKTDSRPIADADHNNSDYEIGIILRSEMNSTGYLIDRPRFDRELARQAASCGTIVFSGTQLISVDDEVWHVKDSRGIHEIRSRFVIGADGAMSRTARLLGLKNPSVLKGVQAEVPLTKPLTKTIVVLHPSIEGGYAWLFPKGSVANVGLGVEPHSAHSPADLLEALLEWLIREGIVRPGSIAGTGGLIPVSGMRENLVIGNVILCGDAAGLTHPITGAGIPQAIISGTRAGETVAQAAQSDSSEYSAILSLYEREIRSHYSGVLLHAVKKRRRMIADLDKQNYIDVCRKCWIGFKEYRLRERNEC